MDIREAHAYSRDQVEEEECPSFTSEVRHEIQRDVKDDRIQNLKVAEPVSTLQRLIMLGVPCTACPST